MERRRVLAYLAGAVFAGCRDTRQQPQQECPPGAKAPEHVALRGLEKIAVSKNLTLVNRDANNSISVDPAKLQEYVNSPTLGALNLPENVVFLVHFVPTSLMSKELQDQAIKKYTNVASDITLLRERMRELEKQNKKLPPQRPVNIPISIPDAIKGVENIFVSENQEKESCQFQLLLGTYLALAIFGSIARTMPRGQVDIQSGKSNTLVSFGKLHKPVRIQLNGEFLSNLLK